MKQETRATSRRGGLTLRPPGLWKLEKFSRYTQHSRANNIAVKKLKEEFSFLIRLYYGLLSILSSRVISRVVNRLIIMQVLIDRLERLLAFEELVA